jgi:hypothetical protein
MTDDHDDDKVIDYLRSRAQVRVPNDVLQRATARAIGARAGGRSSVAVRGLSLAAAAVLVAVVVVLVASLPANGPVASTYPSNAAVVAPGSGSQTASPSQSPMTVSSPSVGAPFPSTVLGMQVITVAQATALAQAGQLNGRDVAVAGWYVSMAPSCPYPGPYVGELEDWCSMAAFSDTQAGAQICVQTGNGMSCSGFGQESMAPWLMTDTLGDPADQGVTPVPIVVIGHTDDARARQCRPGTETQCARDFVADRVAWATVDLQPEPNAFAYRDYKSLTPNLNIANLAAAIGDGDQLISAAATTADGIRSLDPRWNETGSRLQWIVRSVPTNVDGGDPTRPVTVWLIDDATGQVVDSHPLALPADYNPARLWVTATIHNPDPNYGNSISAFDRVQGQDGEPLQDGQISGGYEGGQGVTNIGPDLPLLIDPGTYALGAWLATRDAGPAATPNVQCSTQATFSAGDDVLLVASFDKDGACSGWSNEEQPSFGYQ